MAMMLGMAKRAKSWLIGRVPGDLQGHWKLIPSVPVMELIHFRYLSFVSANASEDNSQYKYCDGKSAEDIGGHKAEPGTKGFWAALFPLLFFAKSLPYTQKNMIPARPAPNGQI